MDDARRIAWEVLNRCESAATFSNIALDTAIRRAELSAPDRGLLTVLVYGVIERMLTLDAAIDRLCRDSEGMMPEARNLLRLGIYQLAYLDRVPDHAAVNETVALAPRRYRGFVNAVLRAFLRDGKKLPIPDVDADPIGFLSVKYSFCKELCELFLDTFGLERTERLFAAFCRETPLQLRVNTLRVDRETLCKRLAEAGFDARPSDTCATAVAVHGKAPVTSLPGFSEGWFFVQDEASQRCVRALDAQKGMAVLDTCACPGSKSFGAAIDMNNDGRVLSCDLHKNKLSLITSGAERLGITVISTEARDARDPCAEREGTFDRVLCDVPCSGFGVFAKKPELKYKDPDASAALPVIQREILACASRYVRVGGRIVYSTCTLLPRENEENVSDFLARNAAFSLCEMRTLYPDTDGTDGFFYAVMERTR